MFAWHCRRSKIHGTALGGFHQGATRDVAERTLARGMGHIFVETGLFSLCGVMVVIIMAAAAGGGGMFGHRVTVLRAII